MIYTLLNTKRDILNEINKMFISTCATIKDYLYTKDVGMYTKHELTLTGIIDRRYSLTNFLQGSIKAIDGKPIDGIKIYLGHSHFGLRLTPGWHTITIQIFTSTWKNKINSNSKNQIDLSLNAKSGYYYMPQVKLIDNHIKIWIKDQENKISSRIIIVPRVITSIEGQ